MHEKHPTFLEPEDVNTKIWRYIDFQKLLSLLDRRSLFFVKANKMFDPFEGTLPAFNKTNRLSVYSQYRNNFPTQEAFDNFIQSSWQLEEGFKLLKSTILINSWHINEYESAAMWDLYSEKKAGFAIHSTFKRLSDSFKDNEDDTIWIGKVNYKDYEKEWMNEWNVYEAFVIKRKSFEHERELRAITALPEEGFGEPVLGESDKIREASSPSIKRQIDPQQMTQSGKYVPIDLDILVEKIYTSPLAQPWLHELAESMLEKFSIDKSKILKSDLYTLP